MFDRIILQTLQQATTAAIEASITPLLPVKYVAVPFTVPNDQKWLETVHIPNNRNNDHWNDEKNYAGMFRLILHWPVNSSGAYGPIDTLASICAYFTKDRQLTNGVHITVAPDFNGVLEQPSANLFPASMRYSCFRP